MSNIKKLVSQTAYYGVSSILGRMLNYALVPLHTRVLLHQSDYGLLGELYAYVSFLNIIFLCGMETAFFRFSNTENSKSEVYNTAFTWVMIVALVLSSGMIFFSSELTYFLSPSKALNMIYKREYIIYFALIIGFDAISTIPFSLLRQENRPQKFALIKVLNIIINVGLNLYFLWLCPVLFSQDPSNILLMGFTPSNMLSYVLIANLIASISTLFFLHKELVRVRLGLAKGLIKKMLYYALPLLVAGLAGMTNETLDRILLKYSLKGNLQERLTQIGIYNAAYKLSIFMTLAVQSFRMAAEPFFFSLHKQKDARIIYATVMNYFVAVCWLIFLGVSMHLDILTLILGEKYRSGVGIVPVLLLANMFLGIYLNLSIWFKLADKTYWGIIITVIGAILTVVLNVLLIPKYGYWGSAWATLLCYATMVILGYISGQKYYLIPYNIQRIGLFSCVGILTFIINKYCIQEVINSFWLRQSLQSLFFTMVVGLFVFYVYKYRNHLNVV